MIQWRDEFLKYADIDGKYYPFIVVGNKVRLYYITNIRNYIRKAKKDKIKF